MKRGTIEHPKMKRLARLLGCHQLLAVGLMEALWHWTAKYAPSGDIGKHSDDDIVDGIGFSLDLSRHVATASDVVGMLVEAGWLDRDQHHRLLVHDWHEHADDATKKAVERKKLCLISQVIPPVATSPDTVATSPDKNRLPLPEPGPLPEPDKDSGGNGKPVARRFVKPTLAEVTAYCQERGNHVTPQAFLDYYESNGWRVGGKSPMKDWRAAVRTWELRAEEEYRIKNPPKASRVATQEDAKDWVP